MIVVGSLVVGRASDRDWVKIPAGSIGGTRVVVTTFLTLDHFRYLYCNRELQPRASPLCSSYILNLSALVRLSRTSRRPPLPSRAKFWRILREQKSEGKEAAANVYTQLMANDLGRSR